MAWWVWQNLAHSRKLWSHGGQCSISDTLHIYSGRVVHKDLFSERQRIFLGRWHGLALKPETSETYGCVLWLSHKLHTALPSTVVTFKIIVSAWSYGPSGRLLVQQSGPVWDPILLWDMHKAKSMVCHKVYASELYSSVGNMLPPEPKEGYLTWASFFILNVTILYLGWHVLMYLITGSLKFLPIW